MIRKRYCTCILLLATLFLVTGCGGEKNPQGRKAIRGTVTLGGAPLKSGSISFEPVGSQTERTASGAAIVDGAYSIEAARGAVPGEYAVRIMAVESEPIPADADPMNYSPVTKDLVPPEFGAKSTQKVTVDESGKNVFDFNM